MNGSHLIESLEERRLYSVTTTTTCIKVPGPTDTQVVTATNPAGNQVPGQSSTTTVRNRDCK
jgi:hypothetical protein